MTSHRPSTTAPTGLPILSAGAHLVPEDGACLMEYVSVLAGEPFSDAPRCTDPLLATLARLVNDATDDRRRDRLGTLATGLAAAPRTDAVGAATVVLATLVRVREAAGPSRRLDRHLRCARRHLRRAVAGGRGRWPEIAHRRGSGRRRLTAAVAATAVLPEARRSAVLHDVLAAAVALLRASAPTGERAVADDAAGLFTGHL